MGMVLSHSMHSETPALMLPSTHSLTPTHTHTHSQPTPLPPPPTPLPLPLPPPTQSHSHPRPPTPTPTPTRSHPRPHAHIHTHTLTPYLLLTWFPHASRRPHGLSQRSTPSLHAARRRVAPHAQARSVTTSHGGQSPGGWHGAGQGCPHVRSRPHGRPQLKAWWPHRRLLRRLPPACTPRTCGVRDAG